MYPDNCSFYIFFCMYVCSRITIYKWTVDKNINLQLGLYCASSALWVCVCVSPVCMYVCISVVCVTVCVPVYYSDYRQLFLP